MQPSNENPAYRQRAIDFALDRVLTFWRDKMLFGGFAFIGVAIFLIFNFQREHLSSVNDLCEVVGTFAAYNVHPAGKGTHHGVVLNEFAHDFTIHADNIDSFNESEFRKSVKFGDTIFISIPKSALKMVNSDHYILALGVRDNKMVFMDPQSALPELLHSRLFATILVLTLGSMLFLGRLGFLTITR